MAGVVAVSSCNKDDDPEEEGKKFAREACACITTAVSTFNALTSPTEAQFDAIDDALENCLDALENKYSKWDDNDKFWDAAEKEIKNNCASAPHWQEIVDEWD